MSPTLNDKDSVTYIKSAFICKWWWYRNGDIIIFTPANTMYTHDDENNDIEVDLMVKRIHTRGVVDGSFHVIGDNADNSEDSRKIGDVQHESIEGRAIFV